MVQQCLAKAGSRLSRAAVLGDGVLAVSSSGADHHGENPSMQRTEGTRILLVIVVLGAIIKVIRELAGGSGESI